MEITGAIPKKTGLIEASLKKVSRVFTLLAMFFFVVVVVCTSADVFKRLIGGSSLAWAQITAVFANDYVVFLFMAVMLLEGGHTIVEFFYEKTRGAIRKILTLSNDLSYVAFFVILSISSVLYFLDLYKNHTTKVVGTSLLPYWPVYVSFPIGVIISLVIVVFQLIKNLRTKEK